MRKALLFLWFLCLFFTCVDGSQGDLVDMFGLKSGSLHLSRAVQPGRYLESTGQKSAIMGTEDGNFEVWVYPYKVLHNLRLHFLIEEKNEMIDGQKLATRIDVYPHQSILRYVHSSFRAEAILFTPLRESGAVILISIETIVPLSIVASFTPDLKPMWPAGLGGQYSYWDSEKGYFVISEGTRKNVALVGSPTGERFSSGPAHALPEGDMKLKIPVDSEKAKRFFYPVFIVANHEGRKKADEIYARLSKDLKKLYLEKFSHFEKLEREYLSVQTPDEKIE